MFEKLRELREKLPPPGPYENLHKESRMMFPTAFQIEGAKFDLSSLMSQNFQVSHSFAWGSTQAPPSYHFAAGYSTPRVLLHGMLDHDGSLQARANYHWVPVPQPEIVKKEGEEDEVKLAVSPKVTSTSKMQAQISRGQSIMQLEHDHQDTDFSLNFKAINPSPVLQPGAQVKGVTGIFSASYLQSVSQSWAVGAELAHQHPNPTVSETSVNYALRWSPPPAKLPLPPLFPPDLPVPFLNVNPKDPTEVFTATWAPSSGVLQSTYWRRINPRLEVASELQLLMTPSSKHGLGRRGGLASVGFKFETIYATIRAMVDTHGRVSTVLEEKIAPGLQFTISAEMDYSQGRGGQGKVGFGFTLEA